jgi:Ca-activated chloride channel family protein
MSFIWPAMLVSMLLIPLLIWLYFRYQRRRRQIAANFSSLLPAQGAEGRTKRWRLHLPAALFLAGLAILMLAMARPQTTVSLPKVQGTLILTFDVSGSMAADDLKPTRMEASKAAAREFVQQQPLNVQIGVVAFSDSGFSVQVPTNDKEAVLASIDRLAPARGTSLANGILVSLNTIAVADAVEDQGYYSNLTPAPTATPTPVPQGVYSPAAIVLLSDGENNIDPDPLEAAQIAADRGVRIFSVGVGSPAGATLEIEGFRVHTQLNEAMLQDISQLTGGAYFNAESEQELLDIYNNLDTRLVIKPEEMEITSILAGAGVLFLLVGGIFSLAWFSRLP